MAESIDSTTCPEQLTTMSGGSKDINVINNLSNPNGNARPQRNRTRSKRIYEGYEMTKISKPIKTMKRRRRQFKKKSLHVDIASNESERPSNVCVIQPHNPEVNVNNNLDDGVIEPNNPEIIHILDDDDSDDDDNNDNNLQSSQHQSYEYMILNKFRHVSSTADYYLKIFPGYNSNNFLKMRTYLFNKNENDFVNREMGTCTYKNLFLIYEPENKLNDVIMTQYFNLIRKNCNRDIYICDTYFFVNLERYGADESVNKCMKDINLFSYSKIVIPTHIVDHWVLIVVNVEERKILFYDSLDYTRSIKKKIKLLIQFLYKKYFMQQGIYKIENLFEDVSGSSPKQSNSMDCGIFTCINATHSIYNKSLNYTQADIPLYRHKILYEIVFSKLLPVQ